MQNYNYKEIVCFEKYSCGRGCQVGGHYRDLRYVYQIISFGSFKNETDFLGSCYNVSAYNYFFKSYIYRVGDF